MATRDQSGRQYRKQEYGEFYRAVLGGLLAGGTPEVMAMTPDALAELAERNAKAAFNRFLRMNP